MTTPEDARAILRGQGLCGRISKRELAGDPLAGKLGLTEDVACILPIGHDLGAHETSKEDVAAELALAHSKIRELRDTIDTLEGHLGDARDKLRDLNVQKDAVYTERNRLVAALAWIALGRRHAIDEPCPTHNTRDCNCDVGRAFRLALNRSSIGGFDAWLGRHSESDAAWDPEWRTIVYILTPHGQLSWHVHDSDVPMFQMLKFEEHRVWDLHTTEEKYRRLELVR